MAAGDVAAARPRRGGLMISSESAALAAGAAVGGVQPRRSWRSIYRRAVVPWLFLLPILLLNAVVVLGPAISSMYYSLTDWSGIGPATFIGLENFQRLFFVDTAFKRAFVNNLVWLLIFLTVPMAMGLLAASLLSTVRRGALVYRMTIFIPFVLPTVVVASIWRGLLNPRLGIGAQLSSWGIGGLDRAFLGNSQTVLPAIAFVANWAWWGFLMVLFLAAMQNIAPDLYEAARLDGANRWQEFRDVTLPGIRPTLVFMILMTTIWSFLTFDFVWILTQGGPAGASEVLASLVYKQAFLNYHAGYAAAIGLTMSAMVGIAIGVFLFLRRRGWEI
jgi:raffinose/stachyose/melibiose transport system permease protein